MTYTFVDANGCSAKDSVLFNILDTSRYDLSRIELCPEYNIVVNGIRYDINKPIGTEILRGQNKNGCDSIVNIHLSFLQEPTAQNDPFDLPNDSPFIEIDPLINDNFRPIPLFRRLDSPKYGQLDSLPNNHFRYTRTALLTGDVSFRYAICDRICPSVCDTATVTIHIDDFELKNKIAITPNNDAMNDALVFDLLENDPQRFGNAKLLIFNLLGQVIYQQQPYENKWMGTFQNGQNIPEGAYLFLLILNDRNKEKEQICGSVTVIRGY